MKNEYEIKLLEEGLLNAVTEADRNCFPNSPWGCEGFLKCLCSDYDKCFICVNDGGELLGYSILRCLDAAEILIIATVEKARRRGIAGALMERMLETCKAKEIGEIFLEVREKNLPALSLYKKCGFEELYKRKNYYSNPADNAVVMRKSL